MEKILVEKLLGGSAYKTQVWAANSVQEALADLIAEGKRSALFVKKLNHFAQAGFGNFIGPERPIRLEWRDVYRIGLHGQLFRVVGFFTTKRDEFIAVEAFHKHGTKLRSNERNLIDGVADMRDGNLWEYAE